MTANVATSITMVTTTSISIIEVPSSELFVEARIRWKALAKFLCSVVRRPGRAVAGMVGPSRNGKNGATFFSRGNDSQAFVLGSQRGEGRYRIERRGSEFLPT
jgi:hypothetical protein